MALATAVHSWDPARGAFSTHIFHSVRWALLDHQKKQWSNGFTGGKHPPWLTSLDKPLHEDDDGPQTRHDSVSYPADATPDVLLPPNLGVQQDEEYARLGTALQSLDTSDRRLFEMLATGRTQAAVAEAEGISQPAVAQRRNRLVQFLAGKVH